MVDYKKCRCRFFKICLWIWKDHDESSFSSMVSSFGFINLSDLLLVSIDFHLGAIPLAIEKHMMRFSPQNHVLRDYFGVVGGVVTRKDLLSMVSELYMKLRYYPDPRKIWIQGWEDIEKCFKTPIQGAESLRNE